jgi:hypothetical protein
MKRSSKSTGDQGPHPTVDPENPLPVFRVPYANSALAAGSGIRGRQARAILASKG